MNFTPRTLHRPEPSVAPIPDGVSISALRALCFEDLWVGQTESLTKTVCSSDVVGFAEVTDDRNPIHLSKHFAARTAFGTRIAHGLYTASLFSAVLGTRLPGPGAIYLSQTLNFRAPVRIGDTVLVTVTVAGLLPEKSRARLSCVCRVRGDIVLDGEALVKVPLRSMIRRPRMET
jgi:3-hydroxybutyryl-CoA dehydratase